MFHWFHCELCGAEGDKLTWYFKPVFSNTRSSSPSHIPAGNPPSTLKKNNKTGWALARMQPRALRLRGRSGRLHWYTPPLSNSLVLSKTVGWALTWHFTVVCMRAWTLNAILSSPLTLLVYSSCCWQHAHVTKPSGDILKCGQLGWTSRPAEPSWKIWTVLDEIFMLLSFQWFVHHSPSKGYSFHCSALLKDVSDNRTHWWSSAGWRTAQTSMLWFYTFYIQTRAKTVMVGLYSFLGSLLLSVLCLGILEHALTLFWKFSVALNSL